MKFVRIKYREDNKTEDVIVNLSKTPYIDRTFPNKLNPNLTCLVPDHHIDPRRTALFMARWLLRDIAEGKIS